ncbi:1-acyl-sn-glycerol-3-phosphate acyltransferase [Candidatus Woesearchaeota archaeon]|nr:1-acyl-sn-glycerol-3-phosphate acyltransferase [Candidatus Woesearchaeota archaeon]
MAYPISKLIIPPIYRLWIRKIEGVNNIPHDKAFIVAVNHSSYFDAFLLPIIIVPKINRNMHAWVNAYYWKNQVSKFFLDLWGGIPMHVAKEENAKEKNKASFKLTINYLKDKEPMMIFPEGKRNDGKLLRGYTGIARLALKAKVPVLPCGIIGANKVLPKGKFFPRLARCEVKIGKLMHFDKHYGKKTTKKTLNEITTKIMKEIAELIGQKYNY